MKKNLTKLALSGVALAAVAATLGTSTYAWYTTNPTVSANNIVGASSDQGASSIYIAKDPEAGQAKKWSSEVTFANDDFATAKLVPVQPVAAGGFKLLDGTTNAGATDVLEFSLWFKSSKVANEYVTAAAATDEKPANGIDLYLKSISIANTTATLKPLDNMLYGDTVYSASTYGVDNATPQYNVDFVNALGVRIVDTTEETANIKQTFELDSFQVNTGATAYSTAEQAKTANSFVTTGAAHAYYNQVMPKVKVKDTNGKEPGQEGYVDTFGDALSSTAITAGKALTGKYTKAPLTQLNPTGTNETARKLTFYVYLNGWNDYCYDACQGQQFTLNLQFTKVAADAIASIQ